jgi:hypothetical protein
VLLFKSESFEMREWFLIPIRSKARAEFLGDVDHWCGDDKSMQINTQSKPDGSFYCFTAFRLERTAQAK